MNACGKDAMTFLNMARPQQILFLKMARPPGLQHSEQNHILLKMVLPGLQYSVPKGSLLKTPRPPGLQHSATSDF